MMFQCICCDWIVNQQLGQKQLESLIKQIALWAEKDGFDGEKLVDKVIERIEKIKENLNIYSEKTSICRYCLMEQIELFLENEEKFHEDFTKTYDFDGAIIC